MKNVVGPFDGDLAFLSNFFVRPLKCDNPLLLFAAGIQSDTVEHLFQAAKATNPLQANLILQAPTPGRAKRLGRKCTLRRDWDMIKVTVMRALVEAKFKDPEFRGRLLATGTTPIVELNTWHDCFWGVCTCSRCREQGRNMLGQILSAERINIRIESLLE